MGILSQLFDGANKFSDQLINPTNGLGKLGAYLGAASGAPLGKATLAAMKDERDQGNDDLKLQLLKAQIQKALQPKAGATQQEISDLRANGASDDDIANLIQSKTNPFQLLQIQTGTGTQILPMGKATGVAIGGLPNMQSDGLDALPAGYAPRKNGGASGSSSGAPFR